MSDPSSSHSFFLAPFQCSAKWGLCNSASTTFCCCLPFALRVSAWEGKKWPSLWCSRDDVTPRGHRSCTDPLLSRGTSGVGRQGQGRKEPSLGVLKGSCRAGARAWRVRSDGERWNGVGRSAHRKWERALLLLGALAGCGESWRWWRLQPAPPVQTSGDTCLWEGQGGGMCAA